MNSKLVLILIIIFVLLNAVLFLVLNGNPLKIAPQKETISTSLPPAPQNSINLPLPLNHRSVDSAFVTYNFRGKVTEIIPKEKDLIEIKLDTSDSQTPEFIVAKTTIIFMLKENKVEIVKINDVKVALSLELTMAYDTDKKSWDLKAIFINPESP